MIHKIFSTITSQTTWHRQTYYGPGKHRKKKHLEEVKSVIKINIIITIIIFIIIIIVIVKMFYVLQTQIGCASRHITAGAYSEFYSGGQDLIKCQLTRAKRAPSPLPPGHFYPAPSLTRDRLKSFFLVRSIIRWSKALKSAA